MVAISDAEKKKIQDEARNILKKFSVALSKITMPSRQIRQIDKGYRVEGFGILQNEAFRIALFANAPHHDSDSIIAEKKSW